MEEKGSSEADWVNIDLSYAEAAMLVVESKKNNQFNNLWQKFKWEMEIYYICVFHGWSNETHTSSKGLGIQGYVCIRRDRGGVVLLLFDKVFRKKEKGKDLDKLKFG